MVHPPLSDRRSVLLLLLPPLVVVVAAVVEEEGWWWQDHQPLSQLSCIFCALIPCGNEMRGSSKSMAGALSLQPLPRALRFPRCPMLWTIDISIPCAPLQTRPAVHQCSYTITEA